MNWLLHPTRFLFFTGKGGVGKTSLSAATAIYLADAGKRVLLVSTDAASNLDEMLGVTLSNHPTDVPGVVGLSLLNIDPDDAAQAYRLRVLDQMGVEASEQERSTVLEQLSGACTTEIASFDEFSSLLADQAEPYDHVVFDTAPSGHTLRLLSLPKAWSGFLAGNDRGASCLGPHSGLKMQEERFNQALRALSDSSLTSVMLVARPEGSALSEAARTSEELRVLGLSNQRLIVNGVFHRTMKEDKVAQAIEEQGRLAMRHMPLALQGLPIEEVPLRCLDSVGLPALRALLSDSPSELTPVLTASVDMNTPHLAALVAELAKQDQGLIMVMGKLLEDLQSPCTEEVAVFHAFSHIVAQAQRGFVVLDTAPTGHSLLLMDAAGAYHRQMLSTFEKRAGSSVNLVTPLMRMQDPNYTRIILVTLPELTPVSQAAALQTDLRRAKIEPYAWVMNRSVLAAKPQDPLLLSRLEGERKQMQRIAHGLSERLFVIPFLAHPPVGVDALTTLLAS